MLIAIWFVVLSAVTASTGFRFCKRYDDGGDFVPWLLACTGIGVLALVSIASDVIGLGFVWFYHRLYSPSSDTASVLSAALLTLALAASYLSLLTMGPYYAIKASRLRRVRAKQKQIAAKVTNDLMKRFGPTVSRDSENK